MTWRDHRNVKLLEKIKKITASKNKEIASLKAGIKDELPVEPETRITLISVTTN